MDQDRINRGKLIFKIEQDDNPFKPTAKVAKIVYSEWFTSGHDDTGSAVSLCDENNNILWETRIPDVFRKDIGALIAYLQAEFQCPVEEVWLG